jgi:uncharacterized protein YdaU (DUF1376 family)
MEEKTNKFHALQLFTDTFAAETVHLTNEAIGIYIRLLSFAWTKNAKPFKTESAYRICQCRDDNCCINVYEVLEEFFILQSENKEDRNKNTWTHKRLTAEHEYLTAKYKRKSIAGKKGADVRYSANGKTMAPIPIPKPIPNKNIYDQSFEELWSSLNIKRGSKFSANKIFQKISEEIQNIDIAEIYNKQQSGVEAKFVPHFSTWLMQRRWEIQEQDQKHQENPADLRTKMENLGYNFRHSEDNFDYFKKDGKEYKIDRYDKDHIIHNVE